VGKFTSLEKCCLTKDWRIEERAALAHYLEKQELTKNEPLFIEDHSERKLYIIDSGLVSVSLGFMTVEMGPGQSLGEFSLFQDTKKKTTAIALEDCSFWVLTLERWELVKEEVPDVAAKLTQSINQKMANLLEISQLPPRVSEMITGRSFHDTEVHRQI